MKKKYFITLSLLLIIPLQLGYLFLSNQDSGNVAGIGMIQNEILNSASIGEFRFTLFGYTSPFAEINLNGQGIADQTVADSTGYFEFKNRFSPFSPHEACLSSKDQFGRISAPVCLPDFPTQYNVTIGPVIIPPTISLDKPNYFTGDEVILSGQTIPDSEINLSMFTGSLKKGLSLIGTVPMIKPVEAFSIPQLTAKSDNKGNFSISLPSSSSQNYRLFTQVNYQNSQSPNSLALKVEILPVWMIIVRFFLSLITVIKSRLLEIIIASEIIYLTLAFFKMIEKKNRAIILAPKESIVLHQENPLVKA